MPLEAASAKPSLLSMMRTKMAEGSDASAAVGVDAAGRSKTAKTGAKRSTSEPRGKSGKDKSVKRQKPTVTVKAELRSLGEADPAQLDAKSAKKAKQEKAAKAPAAKPAKPAPAAKAAAKPAKPAPAAKAAKAPAAKGPKDAPQVPEAAKVPESLAGRIFQTAARIADRPAAEAREAREATEVLLADGKTAAEAQATVEEAQRAALRQRRAGRMAFNRSLEPATKRSGRAEKVPTEISLKIKANPALQDRYFDLWMNSHQSWGLVEIIETVHELEKHKSKQVKRWMNVMQMLDHYKMESIVSSVVAEKLKTPAEWRMCPDAPTDGNAKEFAILVVDEQSSEVIWMRERLTKMTAMLQQEEAKHILGGRIRRPVWVGASGADESVTPPPGGKTPEEIAAEEELKQKEKKQKEIEKQAKIEELKRQREAYKNSDIGKSQKWTASVTKDISTLGKILEQIREQSAKVGQSTRDEYQLTITGHIEVLTTARQDLEKITAGTNTDTEVLGAVKSKGDNAAEDVKKWKKIRRIYYPKEE